MEWCGVENGWAAWLLLMGSLRVEVHCIVFLSLFGDTGWASRHGHVIALGKMDP